MLAIATDASLFPQAWQDPSPVMLLYSALSVLEASPSEVPQSWCGGVEAGVLATAPLRCEGTKARRKRKRAECDLSGAEGISPSDRAVWASREGQITAYRCHSDLGVLIVMPHPRQGHAYPLICHEYVF